MPDLVIENPIINSPYQSPSRHFAFDRDGITDRIIESRRPSSFFVPVPRPRKRGQQAELPIFTQDDITQNRQVNELRANVTAWRQRGWPDVTPATRRLLEYWADPDRENKLMFCQREAAETAIFLTEAASRWHGSWIINALAEQNAEHNNGLPRVALKMATGTGKTVVMAMLIAWQTVNKVWVAPRRVGSPGVPADVVTVRTRSGELPVEVWIEPVGGQWRPAGPGGTPLDLGIVATHAALVTGAGSPEVVMWSLARMRNPDGSPMPDPRRPSEWLWNFWEMEDVEVRALATDTLRTRDRDMAADGVTVRRNTFCAGNAHLPDGRLLVAGGHLTPTDNHNGGYLHIYDAAAPAGWRELATRLVPQRWYPTVTALPDGRMLITSGAQQIPRRDDEIDLGPNGYWNTINNDYRIFDPATERLLDPGPVSLVDEVELAADDQRLATYPSVFVLPADAREGTVVALAETTRAWLFTYQPDQPAPLSRVDRVYHMSTQGSRSYPTYGAMVLLPLTAGEPEARILAVGGKHETNRDYRSLAANQPATATTEVLRLDLTRPLSDQPGWQRTPDLASPRVLCDTTLLADGSVLVSGGAQQGWGDLNSGPVLACELFDPQTETFRPAAPASTERRYHSTALLQPDGTVLKAGSTGGFGEDRNPDGYLWMRPRTDAERYYPPYLFRGPRPLIVHIDPATGRRSATTRS